MRQSAIRFGGLLVLLGLALAGPSWTAEPQLNSVLPRGVQRGTETEVVLSGARLADAQALLLYTPGIEVLGLEPADNQVKAKLKIAANCPLGEHALRVRAATGVSELRTFYVGALPIVEEKEPNSEFGQPQPIELNVTVHGTIGNEDVDYYAVTLKKGQRLSAEIEAMRLGSALFDPYLAILDSKRFELTADDDTPLARQDAAVSIVAPEDGVYVVQVRESAYGSGSYYRLHVGTFPRPTAVYPPGGKLGEEIEVRFLGDAGGELVQRVKLPEAPQEDFGLLAQDAGGLAPSANVFRLSPHGNVLEQEPNDTLAEATPGELPLNFNGRIERPGDVDHFRFKAVKGQVYDIHCFARRIRSPLDPVMVLQRASDGGGVASNDDAVGPDSYFRWQAPDDNEYVLRVTDHLGRGGEDFVYRIEFLPVEATLALSLPKIGQYSQIRQTIVVPRGNRYATLVNCARNNFGGELTLEAADLPPGVRMVAEPVPANLSAVPVLFEAAADAPIGGTLAQLSGKHADPNQSVRGAFDQTVELIIGNPGQSIYWSYHTDRVAVAVVEESPFTLEIVEPKVPLVRNGSMQLKIVAHRREGFTAPIRVEFPFRPPGIGAAASVTIPENQNEVLYPVNAAGNAALGKWKVFALGEASPAGRIWVSSQLAVVEVAEPFVSVALQRTACEQGQSAEVVCKLTHHMPFEGTAKVMLLGLPAKCTAPELEFTKETQELVFPIQTDPASPVGNHKNILCQAVITVNNEPILHGLGSTELQIDKPLPAPTTPPPQTVAQQPAAAPMPQPMPEKRLSRLEKLRLEAQKRKEQSQAEPAAPGN